jgi:UDP-N-acetylmuramoyl-L-alanyl-D-glutamate--2,6-diaminopimelate ligase
MGKAAQVADIIYVTDDNPRTENPRAIRAEILKTCDKAIEIGYRREAIGKAIRNLSDGDILLIAGKGHETGQIVGEKTQPFDDRDVARAALKNADAPS